MAVSDSMIKLVCNRTIFIGSEIICSYSAAPFRQMLLLGEVQYLQHMINVCTLSGIKDIEHHLYQAFFIELCHNYLNISGAKIYVFFYFTKFIELKIENKGQKAKGEGRKAKG